MKAIILAAGMGSRLKSHTKKQPKCLVKLSGHNLIDIQLSVLRKLGLTDITIVGGYLSEMIERTGTTLRVNNQYSETNMVWTLACAKEMIAGDVIVTYGDIIYSPHILNELLSNEDEIAVTVDKNWRSYWESRFEDPLSDAETLKLGDNSEIIDIGQKPNSLDEIDSQYMGLMRFNGRGAALLSELIEAGFKGQEFCGRSMRNAYMTDLLQHIIKTRNRITAVQIEHSWVEIDTPEDLENRVSLDRANKILSDLDEFNVLPPYN